MVSQLLNKYRVLNFGLFDFKTLITRRLAEGRFKKRRRPHQCNNDHYVFRTSSLFSLNPKRPTYPGIYLPRDYEVRNTTNAVDVRPTVDA